MIASRRTRAVVVSLVGLLVLAAAATPGTAAGGPEIVRFDIDRTGRANFLSAACGIEVTSHVRGHVIARTFTDGTGVAEITTVNLAVLAMAGDNTYRYRNVGADIVQVTPDGTPILLITGQAPWGFTGVMKIDLASGEVILEPQHSLQGNIEEACTALTA